MMPHNGKTQRLLPLDVLSDLLDGVIDEILVRLPLRDAVRTSILSRKWRYKWCRIPKLKLDQILWKTTHDLIDSAIGFTNIVYHLFAFHTGPITKFTLDIPHLKICPNINNLIHFLSRNDIQHVVLKLPIGNRYKLPSSFFTCSQLRHMFLEHCLIRLPPLFKSFNSLQLIEVTISSEMLGTLITHCPLLEHLVLKHHEDSKHIEVTALNLKSFYFKGNINFLHLKNVPLLSKVSYEPTKFSVKTKHDLAKIFESIPALENLCWNQFHFQVEDAGLVDLVPTRLPFALNCLKRLCVCWITLGEFFELSFALCLIGSSPCLEEIEIEVCIDPDGEYYQLVPPDAVDEIPASFSDTTFNHLRTVKIYDVAGAGAEMQLIKVLLAKSPALLKMVIKLCGMEDKKSLQILAEITNFQRASCGAEVVIM